MIPCYSRTSIIKLELCTMELLDSKNGSLQHNAAFALYGLAENGVTIYIVPVLLHACWKTHKCAYPLTSASIEE